MTDIQQWRRKIQPARARTPAVPDSYEDSESVPLPMTPKRGLKPKLSSYFTKDTGTVQAPRADALISLPSHDFDTIALPTWLDSQAFPSPQAESLLDSIMCRIVAEPYATLEPRFNGMLLQIFEAYRTLSEAKTEAQSQLVCEANQRKALFQRMETAQKQWFEERQDFKAEIKRLELMLAKGKRGVAEVTLARQDSALRQKESERRDGAEDDGLETILECLEKTKRHDDKVWSNQRATFRTRRPSPSAEMRRLSKQFAGNETVSGGHSDLPFDAPTHLMPNAMSSDVSEDTFSTFSCARDLLSDETTDVNFVTDEEYGTLGHIANVFARRRGIDPCDVMPKLFDLFDAPSSPSHEVNHMPRSPVPKHDNMVFHGVPEKSSAGPQLRKQPSLMAKASGLFHKLRPQASLDAHKTLRHRFSFETGDDAVTITSPLALNVPHRLGERVLRKSVSLSSFTEVAPRAKEAQHALSHVAQSPTASTLPSDSRRVSRIPTPAYGAGCLLRPRKEREDSASSQLTAFKHTETMTKYSTTSSAKSSPISSRRALLEGQQESEAEPSTSISPLTDRTRVLGTNATMRESVVHDAAVRVARRRRSGLHGCEDLQYSNRQPRAQSSQAKRTQDSCTSSSSSEAHKENVRPMAAGYHHAWEEGYATP